MVVKMPRKPKKPVLTYRSGLEVQVADQLNRLKVNYMFEPKDGKIVYEIPASTHSYTPDFVIATKSDNVIIVETKGIWDYADRYKHLLIRQQYPNLDIRFVVTRSKQRIRKGSSTTYADICDGLGRAPFKGVHWLYADKRVPEEWLRE
jgi:hypothetical protein